MRSAIWNPTGVISSLWMLESISRKLRHASHGGELSFLLIKVRQHLIGITQGIFFKFLLIEFVEGYICESLVRCLLFLYVIRELLVSY